jgi:hypothetical protein
VGAQERAAEPTHVVALRADRLILWKSASGIPSGCGVRFCFRTPESEKATLTELCSHRRRVPTTANNGSPQAGW